MKIEHRIPTTQFGYISVYFEVDDDLTADRLKWLMADHAKLLEAYNAPQSLSGLEPKDFNGFIDRQLLGHNKSEDIPLYESMGEQKVFSQKDVVQIIKRAKKRINAAEGRDIQAKDIN